MLLSLKFSFQVSAIVRDAQFLWKQYNFDHMICISQVCGVTHFFGFMDIGHIQKQSLSNFFRIPCTKKIWKSVQFFYHVIRKQETRNVLLKLFVVFWSVKSIQANEKKQYNIHSKAI